MSKHGVVGGWLWVFSEKKICSQIKYYKKKLTRKVQTINTCNITTL